MFTTPVDLGLFDGDAGVPIEQEFGDFGAGEPLAVGLDNCRVIRRDTVERDLPRLLQDRFAAGDRRKGRPIVGKRLGAHCGVSQFGEHLF